MSHEYDMLRKELERLSAKVDVLNANIERTVMSSSDADEVLRKHCWLLTRELKDAFERIINLELTVFPNLQKDMDQVYKTIGDGEDKLDNPLDRRKPK